MRRSAKLILASLGALSLPMPAAAAPAADPDDICGAIARIAAAARERPAFRSVRRVLAAEESVVPGFQADECSVTAAGVECEGRRFRSVFRNWPDLATCPGVSAFEPRPGLRVRFPSNRSYRFGRFLIARGVRCPGCAGLGASFFSMTFYRPPGPRR